jgi:capsule polysaccharide export protein KpsE/RkpR
MKKKVDVFDIILALIKNKKIIISFVGAVSIISVIYILLAPKFWESKTSFFYKEKTDNTQLPIDTSLEGLSSSLFGDVRGNPGEELIVIILSRSFSEDIIDRFNLVEYFELQKYEKEVQKDKAYLKLTEQLISVSLDEDTNLITIKVETKDKHFSKEIAEYYLDKIEYYNQHTRETNARKRYRFLQKHAFKIKTEIDSLSNEIMNLQVKSKTIDFENQAKVLLDTYSNFISKKLINELELNVAKEKFNSNNPIITNLYLKEKSIDEIIEKIEKGNAGLSYVTDFEEIPKVLMEYLNLKFHLEIKQKVYAYLVPELEQTKLQELKDLPTIEIIDYPNLAGLRSKPKRGIFCIMMFLASFIFISIIVVLKEFLEEKEIKKIKQILLNLRFKNE